MTTTKPVTDNNKQIVKPNNSAAMAEVRNKRLAYETDHGRVELSIAIVRMQFCPMATDTEAALFIRLCQYQRLNPFLREVYLVKYAQGQAASIVVGKDVFIKRAETHPTYDGFNAGIILKRKEELIYQDGSFMLPGDELVGGWFEGRRKDWTQPFKHQVGFTEYSKNQSTWKSMPATMIRKVAVAQGHREMYSSLFVGLYDAAELGVDAETVEADLADAGVPDLDASAEAQADAPAQAAASATFQVGVCPIHQEPWREGTGDDQHGGLYHPGDPTCTPAKVLGQVAADFAQWTPETVNEYLKKQYDKTMSKLDAQEVHDTIVFLMGMGNQVSETPAEAEAEREEAALTSAELSAPPPPAEDAQQPQLG